MKPRPHCLPLPGIALGLLGLVPAPAPAGLLPPPPPAQIAVTNGVRPLTNWLVIVHPELEFPRGSSAASNALQLLKHNQGPVGLDYRLQPKPAAFPSRFDWSLVTSNRTATNGVPQTSRLLLGSGFTGTNFYQAPPLGDLVNPNYIMPAPVDARGR